MPDLPVKTPARLRPHRVGHKVLRAEALLDVRQVMIVSSIRYALSPRTAAGSRKPCAASAPAVARAACWQARLNASSWS